MKPIKTVYGNLDAMDMQIVFESRDDRIVEYDHTDNAYSYVGKVCVFVRFEDIRYFCDDDLYFVTEIYGFFNTVAEAVSFIKEKGSEIPAYYLRIEPVREEYGFAK